MLEDPRMWPWANHFTSEPSLPHLYSGASDVATTFRCFDDNMGPGKAPNSSTYCYKTTCHVYLAFQLCKGNYQHFSSLYNKLVFAAWRRKFDFD